MSYRFELALVTRVGERREPIIVATVRDERMLRKVLDRAIATAERNARARQADLGRTMCGDVPDTVM